MGAKIRKGDTVKVLSGKDRGSIGKVKHVYPGGKILVEGVRIAKKHMRARRATTPSGIVEMESPIHVSNVLLMCSNCGEPTRVEYQVVEGRKIRACKKCKEVIE
jgi:large subunit ribosomal protein L24